MGKSRIEKNAAPDHADATSGSAGRLVITYVDGSWTDNLAIERYRIQAGPGELMVIFDLVARERPGKMRIARSAYRDFLAKIGVVHHIQVGRPLFARHLGRHVRALEHSQVGVKLRANGSSVSYPARVALGPDAITLDFG